MARVWSCGYELQSLTAGHEFDTVVGSPTIDTVTFRSGAACLRCNATGVAMRVEHQYAPGATTNDTYARVYVRIAAAPSAAGRIMLLRDTTAGGTVCNIRLNVARTLNLTDNASAVLGGTSAALAVDTWYRIEVQVVGTTATAYLDGVEFATGSVGATFDDPSDIRIGVIDAVTLDARFDDVAVNDQTGSFQNGLPGEGEIIHLIPDGAGETTTWTGDYTAVDEVTPNDATDFISSNTAGQIEEVTLSATPAAMESGDVINVVQVGVRFNVSAATGADPNFITRLKKAAGATVQEGTDIDASSVTWLSHAVAAPRVYGLTSYELPGEAGSPWTKATLDTAQIGVRETVTDTHFAQVTILWLLVDHKPAPAGPPLQVIIN